MRKLAALALAAADALAADKEAAPPPEVERAPATEAVVTREGEAASPEQVKKLLTRYATEPTVREVQERAMRYAEVHPEVIQSWRKRSGWAAALPELRAEYQRRDDTLKRVRQSSTGDLSQDDDRVGDRLVGRATWDLKELIFNPDELRVSGESNDLVRLREDVLDQVTKLYYERRRLQVDLDLAPPRDLGGRVRKELRLQELTADVDALTGGWFSERLGEIGKDPY